MKEINYNNFYEKYASPPQEADNLAYENYK